MNCCSMCYFWERGKDETGDEIFNDISNKKINYMGYCNNPKFVYIGSKTKYVNDGICYYDYEGAAAGILTGENFGCIHWRSK